MPTAPNLDNVVHASREQIDTMAHTIVAAACLIGRASLMIHHQLINEVVDEFCDLNYIYPTNDDPQPRQNIWSAVYEKILEIENPERKG